VTGAPRCDECEMLLIVSMKIGASGWDQPRCRMLELGAGLSGVSYSATLKQELDDATSQRHPWSIDLPEPLLVVERVGENLSYVQSKVSIPPI